MNVLITGANGYMGQRLLESLIGQGHNLFCCVRNKARFEILHTHPDIQIQEIDFLDPGDRELPMQVDVAYYLIHSLAAGEGNFEATELVCARNFNKMIANTRAQQIIYLSGIVNEKELSRHLSSRLAVEKVLRSGGIHVTALRAGIIIGSGSASFEIIRDIVEKLPVMITPRWLNTLCQPIAIRNVIQYLSGVMLRAEVYDQDFDIGGPEVLTYKQMLMQFAAVRGLKRYIFTLPVMTPRLSSYWLYFVTATSYSLAVNLVNSMKVNVVCRPNGLQQLLNITLIAYEDSVRLAFQQIEQNMVVSSWKDAFSSSNTSPYLLNYVTVPSFGCYKDSRSREIHNNVHDVVERIWKIGGNTGWYYGNVLWRLRGFMDKLAGGVGLRRGRTNAILLNPGDALDFWRVLVADKKEGRLLLYAEMKLPGEAWLEFTLQSINGKPYLSQVATFRPRGLWGRLYWYVVLPFHHFIFNGMISRLVAG